MRTRPIARALLGIALCLFTLLGVAPGSAEAQPPPAAGAPSAQDLAEAKRHFEIGIKLYGEKAYTEALVEFQETYRLSHKPTALRNVAQCHRDLKQFAEAYDSYQQLLTVHGAELSPTDAAAVRRALDELAVVTGTIKITVSQAGALVEIDGKPIGKAPVPPKRVSVGGHTVRVSKDGFSPFLKEVALSPEQVIDLGVALERNTNAGHLTVREQSGRQVHVYVDEKDMGPTPWDGDLGPGDHTVEVKGGTFASERRTITIAKGERFDIVLDAAPQLGHLRVTTVPASASITVDGKGVGTGAWDGDLPPGHHTIEVTGEGFPKAERDVTIDRGQSLVEEIPLGAVAAGASGAAGASAYRGIYLRFSGFWAFMTRAARYAPPDASVTVDKSFALAGGASVRVGYGFDLLGVELVGAFMMSHFSDGLTFTGPQPTSFSLSNTSVNVFLGAGPRVTTKDPGVRITAGLTPGVVIRSFTFDRSAAPTEFQASGVGYVAPGLLFDGGVLIGSTPGTKLYAGLHGWLDLPSQVAVGPDPTAPIASRYFTQSGQGWILVSGPQFYVGPVIGVQLGH